MTDKINQLPTAEEFLWSGKIITQQECEPYGHLPNEKIPLVMIEFAKLHVTQALNSAFIKIKTDAMETYSSDIPDCWNDDSILNAYPLTNIK